MKITKLTLIALLLTYSTAKADIVLVPDFRVDQDPTSNLLIVGSIASSINHSFFIVSYRRSANSGDLYARKFDLSGNPVGVEFRVETAANGVAEAYAARTAILKNGDIVFSWSDARSGTSHVYYRIFDMNLNPLNSDTIVDQGTSAAGGAISSLPNGGFVIGWSDSRGLSSSVYARIFDSLGNPVGNDFRVDQNPDISSALGDTRAPIVGASPSGNIYFAWPDGRDRGIPPGNIYARVSDSSGSFLGNDFKIDQAPNSVYLSSLAVVPSGNFMVVWRDFRDNGDFGQQTGYGRVFDGSGNPLTNDFRLFQNTPAGLGTGDPAVTSDPSGRFIVGALDARDGGRYLRHLNGIGQFLDIETRIDNGAGSGSGLYLAPVGNQKVFTAWGDSRVASGQIWGNITGPDPNLTPTLSETALIALAILLFSVALWKSRKLAGVRS